MDAEVNALLINVCFSAFVAWRGGNVGESFPVPQRLWTSLFGFFH